MALTAYEPRSIARRESRGTRREWQQGVGIQTPCFHPKEWYTLANEIMYGFGTPYTPSSVEAQRRCWLTRSEEAEDHNTGDWVGG